jgi:hypothetical protein
MQNLWSDGEAADFLEKYAARWGADVALRTYTARLLAQLPRPLAVLPGLARVKVNIFNVSIADVQNSDEQSV